MTTKNIKRLNSPKKLLKDHNHIIISYNWETKIIIKKKLTTDKLV